MSNYFKCSSFCLLCFLSVVSQAGTAAVPDFSQQSSIVNSSQAMTMGLAAAQLTDQSNISNAQSRALQNKQGNPFVTQSPVLQDKKQSDFIRYVFGVTGKDLNVFGSELFQDNVSGFVPQEGAQVNGDYVVGPGDEIQMHGWGMVDIDLTTQVDRSGAIYLPRVGTVKVAGVKFRDLQGYLKAAIKRVFTNFELSVSLSQLRSVQVYVVGHAQRPGTYNLSAMSTLLNALFSSGGPSATGSMRNVQLKRGDKVITKFDLYDMLVHGDKSKDVSLQDGDVIYIPETGPLVAVLGDVKRPAIYELNGKENASQAMEWAGGLSSSAVGKKFIVEWNFNNSFQTVAEVKSSDDISSASSLAGIALVPGSVLRVTAPGAVSVAASNSREFVNVSGYAKNTGSFEIRKGETLREFMARLGGVDEDGYVFGMVFTRDSVRASQQKQLDIVVDRFEQDVESSAAQKISGSTDKDVAANIQKEVERQRSLVQKMRGVKADGRIILELKDGSAALKDLPDMPLQNGDTVYVPRKPGTVEVLGAVYQQNSFIYKSDRTVADYLGMAGGVSLTGNKSEMYLIRADGTVDASGTLLGGVGGLRVNPGDAVVVPENIERSNWTQTVKEWTTILYQFGLGAAGLKVLKN
ncbi:polysaccharide biosynthesis/export family protein [Vogesella oryzae]|uniref:polysaccharide biosynthesis/export family protein n=1 Tax=Vogesella oryzae TaxID=1735285 RepID=UPI0015819486|nr:SLBB domain-containing protein [Vogesella oryzae]